jgi:hypothetical protein
MFNLGAAITNWRRQMAACGIKSPGVLDELESRLREDMEQRRRPGIGLIAKSTTPRILHYN